MKRVATFFCMAALLGMLPTKAQAWWNDDWSARQKVTLDAGANGVSLSDDPGRFPVLIRLHDGDYDFSQSQPDGHDVRIVDGTDKQPIKFQIEQWDPKVGIGLLWVDVTGVKAGAATNLFIYSGNSKAPPPDAGGFDADTVLVYHFAENGTPAKDTSGKGNNAQNAVATIPDGAIGSAAQFDGRSTVTIPASGSLAFATGSPFTLTTWFRVDTAAPNATVFGSADGSLVVGIDRGAPFVQVKSGSSTVQSDRGAAYAAGEWHQLAVVFADRATLYVDGRVVANASVTLPPLNGAFTLGSGFAGSLDEVEISKTARSAGFIEALFATESGPDNRFVSLDQEEKTSSWNGGYFGVILRSVTIDGWVVIGVLAVMSVISWWVMIQKTRQIQLIAKANDDFVGAFKATGGQFTLDAPEQIERQARIFKTSSMYRIYHEGIRELHHRIGQSATPDTVALSSQSILAIRASLDRIATREGQRLNAGIVLLTIAISGGPFVGLFGTVVGVMITFAAIAASGDVNVNAIAPGIAAALVATCAGMAVAIPALFGYNYLLVRINDLTADMHVFIDEFATGLAEQFSPEGRPAAQAAE